MEASDWRMIRSKPLVLKNDKAFYNWLFHYNGYNDTWYAFHRDDLEAYFSGRQGTHIVYKHRELAKLMSHIQFTRKTKTK